jgi:hypothetical protein
MPMHVESSRVEGDNLRLMQSVLSPRCILMGSVRMPDQGSDTQGSAASPPLACRRAGGRRPGPQPSNGNYIEAKRNEASILRHFLHRSETNKLILKL